MYLIISWFFHYGTEPELFRNSSGTKTETLKNCFFSRDIQEEILHMDSVFQFGFGNYSGILPEKTVKLKTCFFPGTFRKKFSIWIQFFSFGSGTIREYLRKKL